MHGTSRDPNPIRKPGDPLAFPSEAVSGTSVEESAEMRLERMAAIIALAVLNLEAKEKADELKDRPKE